MSTVRRQYLISVSTSNIQWGSIEYGLKFLRFYQDFAISMAFIVRVKMIGLEYGAGRLVWTKWISLPLV